MSIFGPEKMPFLHSKNELKICKNRFLAITFDWSVLRTWGQRLWAAFLMLFLGIPHLAIFFIACPYAYMPICPFLAIWAYGHIGICEKIWPNGVSPKRASKMQLRDVDLRSLGHSSQKLWLKINFWIFWAQFPISTDQIKHRKNCECCPVSLLIVR